MQWKKFLPSKLALLCGVLSALASPLWGQWYLVFIVFTPFFLIIDRTSGRELFKESMWIQIIFALGVFFWVPQAMTSLWESPYAVNVGFYLVLATFIELQFILFAFATKFLLEKIKNKIILLFLLPFNYALLDFLYPKFFEDTASHALFNQSNFLSHFDFPYSSIILTWLVVGIANTGTFFLARDRKFKTMLAVWAACVLAVYFAPAKEKVPEKYVSAWSVSFNLNFKEKKLDNYTEKVFQEIVDSLNKIPSNDENQLVLYPETILPFDFQNPITLSEKSMKDELIKIALEKKFSLVIGGGVLVGNDKKNRVFFINTESGEAKINFTEKKILFPFGEYIPGGQIFPWWQELFPKNMLVSRNESDKADIFQWKDLTFSVAICYEALFPYFTADILRQHPDVDFIVNNTNETWFDSFGEPELSFALTRFSALENRIAVLRPTNAGTGGAIDAQSRALDYFRLYPGDSGVIKHYTVPLYKRD